MCFLKLFYKNVSLFGSQNKCFLISAIIAGFARFMKMKQTKFFPPCFAAYYT